MNLKGYIQPFAVFTPMVEDFDNWNNQERRLLRKLRDPISIQNFLDSLSYDAKMDTRSPRWVLKERSANCFEGAMFAAACLRNIGHPPLIVDLRAVNDDDHVIAVFKTRGGWGSIAKSNFTTLRFREPVYRTLRELAMSYFDLYFNTLGDKTLRAYSIPLDLSKFDEGNWMTTEEDLEYIGDILDRSRHYPLIDGAQASDLSKVSEYLMKAGLIGSVPEGLYIPEEPEEKMERK